MLHRCFYRAYRRDHNGDIDKSLIPADILAFYGDDDSEDIEEEESYVEWI